MTLYDFDRFLALSDTVRVRLFPAGEEHAMGSVPVVTVIELTDRLGHDVTTLDDANFYMGVLRSAFPTADTSGELDRLDSGQAARLLSLVRDGSLPDALSPRTAEGNACTAAAGSPSPSRGTRARSAKTPKKS